MKKNILKWSLLMVVPLSMVFAGCNKLLDRKPLRATIEDLSTGKLEGRVLGMYTNLRNFAGFSTLPWIDFHSIRGDDAQKGSDRNDGKEVVTEFDTYDYTKDDWAPNSYWDDHFTMINDANIALAEATDAQATDEKSLRNVGEAMFFRAYSYFELVKTYGEVPLFKGPILKPTDGIRPKSPVDSIYLFIDSNLTAAAQLLPLDASAYGEGYRGRLTTGAAKAMLAQSKLYQKDWASVVSLCNEIIASGQYSLTENFSDNFRESPTGEFKNGPESIFEMQAWSGQNAQSNPAADNGSFWGTSQQVRQNGAPVQWNLGWGWNTPTDKLEAEWPDDDPRKLQTILYSGQNDGGPALGGHMTDPAEKVPDFTNPDGEGGLAQKFWNKKLYTGNPPSMREFTGYINQNGGAYWINHRIIRYADVILMLAEAANEMGDGTTAEANLELIRNRASGNLGEGRTIVPKIPFEDQEQMRQAIKDERRWEFAMEGYRFYDLVRWDDAMDELTEFGYTNRARYYPIPQKAIDLSGGVLEQNPEW
jgi:starch-binding outer membrane protein, SusD/RagB family